MITIHPQATPNLKTLLDHYQVGTPGEVQYKLLNIHQKLTKLGKTHFASLDKGGKSIGTACFCEREIWVNGEVLPAYYIRYFMLHEAYQKKAPRQGRSQSGNNHLKSEIVRILNTPLNPNQKKAIYYAYAELGNQRSRDLCEYFGFEPVRSFRTLAMSRFKPKKSPQVSRVEAAEQKAFKKTLQDYYQTHSFVCLDYTFQQDNYFVLREKGEIVAGVQAHPTHWQITHLPGLEGKFVFHILPYIPYLSRIFSPDFKFVALDTIYAKTGYENLLPTLFESVCAEFNLHSALLWLDTESFLLNKLSTKKLGILHKFHTSTAQLVAKNIHLSDTENDFLRAYPAFISAYDLI